jgi:UDP-N-acetylglucosamine/UDP-N-acetylgalactosamine 4-epimerase
VKNYQKTKNFLTKNMHNWLITGVAGFIGSNLLEELLLLDQKVFGVDDLSTGLKKNLDNVKLNISKKQWKNFKFIKCDISETNNLKKIKDIDFVLHQAARGSVLKSIINPIKTNHSNVTGFLNILNFSKNANVKSFVYASSSSVYGDSKTLPKKEIKVGKVLSNYALTKKINEDYSELFFKQYNFKTIGLRYFNVFGKRQDPNGDYAAVIPRWVNKVIKNEKIYIFGDGKTSRDFTPISNVVQANILAATTKLPIKNYIYNVGASSRITLNKLISTIYETFNIQNSERKILYRPFRSGDIRHSLANISKIKKELEYETNTNFKDSLKSTIRWFINQQ